MMCDVIQWRQIFKTILYPNKNLTYNDPESTFLKIVNVSRQFVIKKNYLKGLAIKIHRITLFLNFAPTHARTHYPPI